jgi:hypothetical protein
MPATKIMIIRHAEKPTTTPPPPTNGVTINGGQDHDSLTRTGLAALSEKSLSNFFSVQSLCSLCLCG